MNKPVEDRDTGEMRVKPKTSLNLTLDFGVRVSRCLLELKNTLQRGYGRAAVPSSSSSSDPGTCAKRRLRVDLQTRRARVAAAGRV